MAKKSKLSASGNTVYTKKYQTFRGVDFSHDASMVDDEHSPYAQNLISDTDGLPEKRLGWRTIKALDSRINGIFTFGRESEKCMIIHAGTKIYKLLDDELTELLDGISDNRSCGKYFNGKLCILTGEEYLVFDGKTCVRAGEYEDIYVPITLMSRGTMMVSNTKLTSDTAFKNWINKGILQNANGSAVNVGATPEDLAINLISGRRKNCFEMPEAGQTVFLLDSTVDYGTRVTMRYIPTGQVLFSVVYDPREDTDYRNYQSPTVAASLGVDVNVFRQMEIGTNIYELYVQIGNNQTRQAGYVLCNINTNRIPNYGYTEGVDNFSIEFTHAAEGYADRIMKCTVMDVYENRLFFSGNPDYPNTDWASGVNDPLFIPDTGYTDIGMDSSRIMGYLRTGSEQAILKSDGDDATIFMRSYSMLSDGTVIFPIKQGISGLGAVSEHAICTFLDDPMYLTRNGVYAIAKQDISSERALNIRSTRVNNKLVKENDLSDAEMCEWNGYLLLRVGDCAYVADAAQKQYPQNSTNTFEYEWYYWTNIPARVLHEAGGELFFGTEDGRLCKFNTDLVNARGEMKNEAYSDDGEAIVAEWSTNLSDDGNFMQKKTLVKTGSGVMLKTYNRSGVSVLVRTDRDFGHEVTSKNAGVFNFEDIDFSEFTFNTAAYSVVPFNARVKKYSAIQIVCRNDKKNHAFGIGGIVRRYFYGKIKK